VFPEGDVAGLAACLRRLRDDPALRRELAARGLARARALFTQDQIGAQTAEVYRQVLAGPPPARRPGSPVARRPGGPAARRPGGPAARRPGGPVAPWVSRRPGYGWRPRSARR